MATVTEEVEMPCQRVSLMLAGTEKTGTHDAVYGDVDKAGR